MITSPTPADVFSERPMTRMHWIERAPVLSILSLTTRPALVFRLFCTGEVAPVIARSHSRRSAELLALALHGQDPRDRSPCLGDRAVVLQLPGRQREAGLPQVLLRLAEGVLELVVGQLADLSDVHRP